MHVGVLTLLAVSGLAFSAPLPSVQGSCASFTILNPDAEPKQDPQIPDDERTDDTDDIVTYTVRNNSPVPSRFVLTWDMRVYPSRSVGGKQDIEVNIHVPSAHTREFLASLNRNHGKTVQPRLQNCSTLRGYDKTPGAPIPW